MNSKRKSEYKLPVGDLYPNLSAAQQEEAGYFLNEYLEVIMNIYDENFDLTDSPLNTTFKPPNDTDP